jgi:hypothetical protein
LDLLWHRPDGVIKIQFQVKDEDDDEDVEDIIADLFDPVQVPNPKLMKRAILRSKDR